MVLVLTHTFFGSSQSRHPMSFKKAEQDPYQEAFLLHTSSLKEHTLATSKGDKVNTRSWLYTSKWTSTYLSPRPTST